MPLLPPAVGLPRLRLLYAAIGGGIGTLLPYLVLYLTSRGLSPTVSGLVIGMMSAVGVVVIPLWGRWSDGGLGVVRALRLSSVLAVAASVALLAVGGSVVGIVVCAALLAAARAPGEALADTLTVGVLPDPSLYGRVRLWASLGFAVTVGCWGLVLRSSDLGLILLGYPLALLVVVASTWGVRAPGVPAVTGEPSATRLDPRTMTLLAGVLVFGIAMGTSFTVLPLRIVDVGGAVSVVGAAMVVGAAAEVPLMHGSSWLARRFGPGPMIIIGGGLFAAALVLSGLIDHPAGLVAASAVRGAGYGLVFVGFVTGVGTLVPAALQARGQSWLQTVLLGVGPIAGASLGGLGYSHLPASVLFSAAAVLALLGVVVAAGVTRAAPGDGTGSRGRDRGGRRRPGP